MKHDERQHYLMRIRELKRKVRMLEMKLAQCERQSERDVDYFMEGYDPGNRGTGEMGQ